MPQKQRLSLPTTPFCILHSVNRIPQNLPEPNRLADCSNSLCYWRKRKSGENFQEARRGCRTRAVTEIKKPAGP
ncbi:hypothetical protein HPB50_027052 [Hyalomma asiaticum]|uniref:Uncharacterized protein n=1 Tax=Hyalomma asiaticum TaxID=266040 RepID=A0ACB7RTH1_HYAAI|nr:hypothetical protein HPB50_027052 [Hyalomma asiaticum]